MPTLISLNFQVYQAQDTVVMTQRYAIFLICDPYITKLSSLSNTRDCDDDPKIRIKGILWITVEYL